MGNPTTTPMRVPDWEQTDPKKSDYIKNRPFYEDDNGNVVKKLDEKFIPDSIARTEDVKKLINEGGGNGSGGTVQTDYLQNDATQPDFLKHRPFYKEKILLTEGQVTVVHEGPEGMQWVEGAYMSAGELPNIEVDGFLKISVEVNDNGRISTVNGVFDGFSIMDAELAELSVCDNLYMGFLEDDAIRMSCGEEIGDVSIKIYTENIKQIDAEFLPSDFNSVPYIAGDGTFSGTPEPSDLPSGACILYGMIGKAVNIHYFEENPTLCNVINDGEGTVKLYWFEEDTDSGMGIRARYVRIVWDDEIIEDSTISLEDLNARISVASDDAYAANEAAEAAFTEATEAKEGVGEALDYAGQAFDAAMVAAEFAEAADQNVTMIMNGDYYFDSIAMTDDNGSVYSIKVGTDGNLKVTKLF